MEGAYNLFGRTLHSLLVRRSKHLWRHRHPRKRNRCSDRGVRHRLGDVQPHGCNQLLLRGSPQGSEIASVCAQCASTVHARVTAKKEAHSLPFRSLCVALPSFYTTNQYLVLLGEEMLASATSTANAQFAARELRNAAGATGGFNFTALPTSTNPPDMMPPYSSNIIIRPFYYATFNLHPFDQLAGTAATTARQIHL